MYEDLIVSAMPRARKFALKHRGSLDPDEAIAIAWLTLVQVARHFDSSRSSFMNFAQFRILGALRDQMRVGPVSGNRETVSQVPCVSFDDPERPLELPDGWNLENAVIAKVCCDKAIAPLRGKAAMVARLMADGWDWTPIRDHLGITDSHMGNAKHRAFLKMRLVLNVSTHP